jgi:hypothetical protein
VVRFYLFRYPNPFPEHLNDVKYVLDSSPSFECIISIFGNVTFKGMAEFNTLCVEKIKNKVLGWAPQRHVENIIEFLEVTPVRHM